MLSCSVESNSLQPWTVALQAPPSMGILQARILACVAILFSRDLPNPGIELRSPALQADSLSSEPPGKPQNTVMGSLSLLQGNFPTQESNWGLLHCRQSLCQLSYQGSPVFSILSNLLPDLFLNVSYFLDYYQWYFSFQCLTVHSWYIKMQVIFLY